MCFDHTTSCKWCHRSECDDGEWTGRGGGRETNAVCHTAWFTRLHRPISAIGRICREFIVKIDPTKIYWLHTFQRPIVHKLNNIKRSFSLFRSLFFFIWLFTRWSVPLPCSSHHRQNCGKHQIGLSPGNDDKTDRTENRRKNWRQFVPINGIEHETHIYSFETPKREQ